MLLHPAPSAMLTYDGFEQVAGEVPAERQLASRYSGYDLQLVLKPTKIDCDRDVAAQEDDGQVLI